MSADLSLPEVVHHPLVPSRTPHNLRRTGLLAKVGAFQCGCILGVQSQQKQEVAVFGI